MTTTTMITTLDLVTPTTDEMPPPPIVTATAATSSSSSKKKRNDDDDDDFSTVVLSDAMVTQSAPSTPIQHRELANAEFGKSKMEGASQVMAVAGNVQQQQQQQQKTSSMNFYTDGFGQIREGLFSCFRPVFGYFGKPAAEIKKSEDDEWEIPFDAISELEWLGSGSQGAVFRGQFEARTVAVKKVKELKEIEIKHLRHLRHENIIEFLGVCSKSPCYCIVMEYCSKGQLCAVLKSKTTITRETFALWVKQIADGMHYLHQNKVIHRDLKSPNILISAEDSIKICDFGTSHLQKKTDSTMMSFCGTVSWMAPEMIKKEPCNEKVDVYSFGVVLWEMLTRETPYANIAQMAIIFGVGTNILSLPIPEEAPRGLVLLIKQCLSQKGRNRPSFSHIRQHWEIFKPELFEMSESEWQTSWDAYREFAKSIQYPSTVTKDHGGPKSAFALEEEAQRKRHEQLNHIKDIRNMYELKLKRTNKMYDKLQGCFSELKLKEHQLAEWERDLTEREQMNNQGSSPRAAKFAHRRGTGGEIGNYYPNEGYERFSSEDEEQFQQQQQAPPSYLRGSPYRLSNTSTTSSGVPSSQSTQFSRQSSCRSSAGVTARSSKLLRNENMRHSASNWEALGARGSPARGSGYSQDSGMWSAGASSMAINGVGGGGGQQVTYSQTLYRNTDGRWSDGRIASRRRVSASMAAASAKPVTFQRDSPSRIPHGPLNVASPRSSSKLARQSYPSRNAPDYGSRAQRAKSVAIGGTTRSCRSPTPYDNNEQQPEQQPVEPEPMMMMKTSPTEDVNVVNNIGSMVMVETTSYDEALKSIGERRRHLEQEQQEEDDDDVAMTSYHVTAAAANAVGYSNPEQNANLDGDVDLTSSMDSRRSRADDADVESSASDDDDDDDVGNGNILNTSIDSRGLSSSKSDEEEDDDNNLRYRIDTSQSTMMSSLERSLELGAARSDGLSDNERRVQAVKNSIKTHRRTHSNPQALIHQRIDEFSSSEATEEDSDDAVRI